MTVNNSWAYNNGWGTTADGFIAKWSATTRSVVTVRIFGSTGGNESVTGMVVDSASNLYVATTYTSLTLVSFGPALANPQYPNAEIAIAKITSANTAVWALRFGSVSNDEVFGIALTPAQDAMYIVGYFTGNVSFGSTNLTSSGSSSDAYVAKLATSNGAVQWAIKLGGAGMDAATSVAVDLTTKIQQGSLIVTGYTSSASFVAGNQTLTTSGSNDGWIVRISPTGNVTWASVVGGASSDMPMTAVAIHNTTGNIYVSGTVNSSSIVFAGVTVTKTGSGSAIDVAKFAPNGTQLWLAIISGSGNDACNSISLNMATESIYVGATMGSSSLTLNGTVITSRLFVFTMNSSGNITGANQVNGASTSLTLNVVRATYVDPYGKLWIGGGFDNVDTVSFNGLTFNEFGLQDAWVALFSSTTLAPLNY